MKIKLLVISSLVFIALINTRMNAQSPSKGCGLANVMEKYIQAHPEVLTQMKQYQEYQTQYINNRKSAKLKTASNPTIIIPVVFHVIHNYGTENISDAQIMNEMDTLNRDYQKMNWDTSLVEAPFNSIIANCNIQWRLAQIDPNGNCTTGIERIPSVKTFNANDGAKFDPWPRSEYMNIWVVNSIGSGDGVVGVTVLGYAYIPTMADGLMSPVDGVLINNIAVGSIGTAGMGLASSPVELSRTLTHELGHTLSLYHTWGPNNSPGVACGDDGITDTPVTMGHDNCGDACDAFCTSDTLINLFTFDSLTTTSGLIDPTPLPINVYNKTLADTVFQFSKAFTAVNTSSNSVINQQLAFTKWDTGGYTNAGNLNPNKYYELVVAPKYGDALKINNIVFTVTTQPNHVQNFAVRTSIDNFTNNLVAKSANNSIIQVQGDNSYMLLQDTSLNINCTVTSGFYTNKPVSIRFYGWNALDSNSIFGINTVSISISAGINENVQNYMEYSTCQKMFTNDQNLAMHAALSSSVAQRDSLGTPTDLKLTGTADPYNYNPTCAPVADFHSNYTSSNLYAINTVPEGDVLYVCQGTPVYFFNNSWGATKIDSVHWTFSTGSPSSVSAAGTPFQNNQNNNYVVTSFDSTGWQTITLTAYNSQGSNTATKYIYVGSSKQAQITGAYYEGFENASEVNANWLVANPSNNSTYWSVTNTASLGGSNSMELNAYYTPTNQYPFDYNIGDIDELTTPSLNLSSLMTGPLELSFDYSYATRSFTPDGVLDNFNIWYSINCGENWVKLASLTPHNDSIINYNLAHPNNIQTLPGDPLFANAGTDPNYYVPSSSAEWTFKSYSLSKLSASQLSNIRFKFKFTSSINSNNLYLDNIGFSNSTSINELQSNSTSINVFPNPASESATIAYHLGSSQAIDLSIYDVVGNKIETLVNQQTAAGDYTVQLNAHNLSRGMYFIRLSMSDKTTTVKKLMIMN